MLLIRGSLTTFGDGHVINHLTLYYYNFKMKRFGWTGLIFFFQISQTAVLTTKNIPFKQEKKMTYSNG